FRRCNFGQGNRRQCVEECTSWREAQRYCAKSTGSLAKSFSLTQMERNLPCNGLPGNTPREFWRLMRPDFIGDVTKTKVFQKLPGSSSKRELGDWAIRPEWPASQLR